MCMVKDEGYIWPWKYKNQGNGQGQTHWSHLRKCKINVTTKIDQNLIKSNQVIYRLGPAIVPNMKKIQKVVQKLSREQEFAASGVNVVVVGGGSTVRTDIKT